MFRPPAALCVAFLIAGCGASPPDAPAKTEATEAHAEGLIALTDEQVAAASITFVQPTAADAGTTIAAPALLESDPQATRVVAATVSGRIVTLTGNLGDSVSRGQTLAVIESREVAALNAEVERARTRAELARVTLARDETLYARGFRPLREVQITRAAAEEATVAVRLARQQVSASGAGGGSLNRIAITAPIAGQVIARTAMLGQTFAADAAETELFRIANLSRLNVALSLSPMDAARVRPGASVEVFAGERRQTARVRFVSPVLDEQTRLVRVLAELDNPAMIWRAGEPVQARIRVAGDPRAAVPLMIPAVAVQTIESRPVVFVRTVTGFRIVPVTLGRRDGPLVAITRGLRGDETIAAANSFTLKAEAGKGDAEHGGH